MDFQISLSSILHSMNLNEAQVIEQETLKDCDREEVVNALQLMTTLATGQ